MKLKRILLLYLRGWLGLGLVVSSLAFTATVQQYPRTSSITSTATSATSLSSHNSTITIGSEANERSSAVVQPSLNFFQQKQQQQSYYAVPPSIFCATRPQDWKQLCPPPSLWNLKHNNNNKDVTVLWTCCEDPHSVATRLLHCLIQQHQEQESPNYFVNSFAGSPKPDFQRSVISTLTQSLTYFRDFCYEHLDLPNNNNTNNNDGHDHHTVQFKARLVLTRGSQGTKCPQWHVDHVPVRWIQAMVGPGCQLVVGDQATAVNWKAMSGLSVEGDSEDDEDNIVAISFQEKNKALVREKVATIYSSQEQEALLLLGNQWPTHAKNFNTNGERFLPVVHKSPTIPGGCERVLLTQDILLDETWK